MKKLSILLLFFIASSCILKEQPKPGETWEYCPIRRHEKSECREMYIMNIVNDDVEYASDGKIWHENVSIFLIGSKKISK